MQGDGHIADADQWVARLSRVSATRACLGEKLVLEFKLAEKDDGITQLPSDSMWSSRTSS
eukprot:29863-Eustigmatos_ZCMA.PRE.1